MLKKTLVVQGQTFEVTYPNAGQVIDIWNAQMLLSDNRYSDMARQDTRLGVFMLDAINAVANFTVLVPGLAKQLNAANFTQLTPPQLKEIVKVYREQYLPWYQELLKELLEEEEAVEEIENKEDVDDQEHA